MQLVRILIKACNSCLARNLSGHNQGIPDKIIRECIWNTNSVILRIAEIIITNKISFEKRNEAIIARLEGRIHGAWTDEVDTELSRASKQTSYLILDLEKLEFIASSGLRTFLKLRREQVGKNGNIVFARPTEVVRETFEVASFEHLFPIYESVKEAFESLNLE